MKHCVSCFILLLTQNDFTEEGEIKDGLGLGLEAFVFSLWIMNEFVKLLGKYNKEAGNQTARDFFWFYFSSIFLWK